MPHINATDWDLALRAKIKAPPYGDLPQDGSADAKIANLINAEENKGPDKPVSIVDAVNYLRLLGLWLPIRQAANAETSIGAMAALDIMQDLRQQSIQFSSSIVQSMFSDLMAKGLLTADNVAALEAMGHTTLFGWQVLGASSELNEHDISRVRYEDLLPAVLAEKLKEVQFQKLSDLEAANEINGEEVENPALPKLPDGSPDPFSQPQKLSWLTVMGLTPVSEADVAAARALT